LYVQTHRHIPYGCNSYVYRFQVNRDADEVNAILDQCNVSGYGESLVHVSNASQAEQLEGVGAIIACVPNLTPVSPEEHMARKIMEVFLHKKGHRGAVLEMCYHPTPHTEIAEISRGAGWQVILGTEAMIYQGLEQDRYWTGKDTVQLPVRRVKEVIARKLEEA
jgi:quinate dehydrogenase